MASIMDLDLLIVVDLIYGTSAAGGTTPMALKECSSAYRFVALHLASVGIGIGVVELSGPILVEFKLRNVKISYVETIRYQNVP